MLGVALLAGAIAFVAARAGTVREAWENTRQSPLWMLALALALPLANYAVVSVSFWVQTRRLGPVRLGEMTALIGAAWLLNFLPLRVGMISRLAYHRAYHGIPIASSIRVIIVGMACGALSVLAALGAIAIAGPSAPTSVHALALGVPALAACAAAGAMELRWRRGYLGVVFLCRYADFLLWAARYALVFGIIGRPISLAGASVVSAACQLTLNVPLAGNGLGLREWAVGLVASYLPEGVLTSSGSLSTATGLSADLVNRAAELIVAPIVGLICVALLYGRMRALRAQTPVPSNAESR